jgi:hypothetical protein
MHCQNCHEIIEPDAAFCGNCGYPVEQAAPPDAASPAPEAAQAAQPYREPLPAAPPNDESTGASPVDAASQPAPLRAPSYAVATPRNHVGESQALLAVICGIIGIVGSGFLVPAIGLIFGVAGLCMATISRRLTHRRRLAIVGLALATVSVAAGFASLAYVSEHDKNTTPSSQTGQSDTSSKVLARLSTPCYAFNLIDTYNVSNSSGTCNTTIFNGQSFNASSSVYKIVATKSEGTDAGEFTEEAQQAIDKDAKTNLSGFTITSEGPSSFAGSLAYSLYAVSKSQDTAIVETGVLHQTSGGSNVFDIVHAVNGTSVNLQSLEAQWKWK